MILRIVFVTVLVLVFVVPIYNLLKRRTTRIKSELEDEPEDASMRLTEIKQKQTKLKKDCDEEIKSAKKRAKKARDIQNKL